MSAVRLFVLISLFYTVNTFGQSEALYCSYDLVANTLSGGWQWGASGEIASSDAAFDIAKENLVNSIAKKMNAQSSECLEEVDRIINQLKQYLLTPDALKPELSENFREKAIELYLIALGMFAKAHDDIFTLSDLKNKLRKTGASDLAGMECSCFERMLFLRTKQKEEASVFDGAAKDVAYYLGLVVVARIVWVIVDMYVNQFP
ncbi:hypothetical protein GZ77_00790 [Endozoicomonas montiporae]|uniref:Uncharacterized protein n=2 Tax=Endozoicomonas montiporae TaxID=1027273 RepID=A0A081N9Y0_9GAMM|nr:hypothetical protein [Endozoicomonas montiporae]AMO57081.1 hypothetical protein EZMO1_3063 [Endozoicomonas montiporae CL-33]KEQ15253.1 hypothetical protein GZ77_00790 [Endozoicomonas montiporae]